MIPTPTLNYSESRVAVDAVIFTVHQGTLKCYLHKREKEPFLESYEIIGGLLQADETAEETLARKVTDTLNIKNYYLEQFAVFTNPQRDPRTRTISIGYVALVPMDNYQEAGEWINVHELPKLAFDHEEIIQKAHIYLQKNCDHFLAGQFMPSHFRLNQLQEAYEAILGQPLDNRNFRKQVLRQGLVIETEKREEGVPYRPARLYKFKD